MEIEEYIYEVVVDPYYKKPTREDYNRADHRRKMRGEATSSNTYYDMSDSDGKFRKRYIYHPKYIPKPTCLIHGTGHSSYEYKVLGDFGSKYSKIRATKNRGQKPAKMNKCDKKQEENSIVQNEVDEIILQDNLKLSV